MPLEIRCCSNCERCDNDNDKDKDNGSLLCFERFLKNACRQVSSEADADADADDPTATNMNFHSRRRSNVCDCSCRRPQVNCSQCHRKFKGKCFLLISCDQHHCCEIDKQKVVIICGCCHVRHADDQHEDNEEADVSSVTVGAKSQSEKVVRREEPNAGTEESQDAHCCGSAEANASEVDTKPCLTTTEQDVADLVETDASTVKYVIHQGLSQKGTDLLEDPAGYTYTKIRSSKQSQFWRCTARSKMNWCRATVSQRGSLFYPGGQPHTHAPEPGKIKAAELRSKIKSSAAQNLYEPATSIVYSAASELLTNESCPQLASIGSLARAANRFRRKLRPQMPPL